ncbi:MAG: alpha/beta hydrolase-fold protein [Prolixibacteraceae bacterium]|jgi:enterochelin esterase family protein|nr:esterase [Prolixibacteraceae bacterium]MDI9564090.1 alpha/beta hydrolase-fold protein [Bacteroidota bacterium]NLS99642.1 esterase [Bacteroidales bacterium]OQB79848.1 MAG: Carbohydrate acetyl esterase/feruloyl esterase precursor [Bacteroidetes bacterium ADurb.Bin123]HNZ69032.1 alpha/beta hydrolase-fold protein [Prolixibacteraceae bacterium]
MKKMSFLITTLFVVVSIYGTFAQQALWSRQEIVSPEIHADNSVTFRFMAPQAGEVKLSGDWMPSEGWAPGSQLMSKDDKGVWSYTTAALPSDLYSYWFIVDGLRCTDPANVYMIRDVASVFNVFIIGGGKGDLYQVNDVAHGTVARRWYNSPGNGMMRRITVYTPPGYEEGKQKYPVLYLLHGMGGDEEAWIALGRTSQILDNLIAQKKANPMIVVMSNGNVAQEAAPGESSLGFTKPTMQLPNTMDGKFEETFPDIIRFIENNYRVRKKKESRAIAGLSMGGYHSLHISRYYPGTFGYVGLFSAAIMPNEQATSKVYQNLDATLETQMKNGLNLYWIGIGKTDFLYKNNVDFREKLDKMGFKYTYLETEGGHTWTNWRIYLTEYAQLIFK